MLVNDCVNVYCDQLFTVQCIPGRRDYECNSETRRPNDHQRLY